DPENLFEQSAPAKTTMTEDNDAAEQPEPDMCLEPGRARADPPPRRHATQSREQPCEHHQRRAEDTVAQTDPAAAGQAAGSPAVEPDVEGRKREAEGERDEEPALVTGIDKQRTNPWAGSPTSGHGLSCRTGAAI